MKKIIMMFVITCMLICSSSSFASEKRHILKLQLKQSHFSLSIIKHIKDSMNTIEFEIPVDKEYYDSVKVGDLLVDKFRTGSLILYGSFGSWKIRVMEKKEM